MFNNAALDKKARKVFFVGFREDFLRHRAAATEAEIEEAFKHFQENDELYATKYRVVKFFVGLGLVLKYLLPGVALACLAISFDLDRHLFG